MVARRRGAAPKDWGHRASADREKGDHRLTNATSCHASGSIEGVVRDAVGHGVGDEDRHRQQNSTAVATSQQHGRERIEYQQSCEVDPEPARQSGVGVEATDKKLRRVDGRAVDQDDHEQQHGAADPPRCAGPESDHKSSVPVDCGIPQSASRATLRKKNHPR